MRFGWVIEGHFLQAISVLLVIGLFLVLFAWLVRPAQAKPREAEEQADATRHTKYKDDDFIGLD